MKTDFEHLSAVPLFQGLDPASMLMLLEQGSLSVATTDRAVIEPDQNRPNQLHVIFSGTAQVAYHLPDCSVQQKTVHEGSCIVDPTFIKPNARSNCFTITALSPLRIFSIERMPIWQAMHSYPNLAINLLNTLGEIDNNATTTAITDNPFHPDNLDLHTGLYSRKWLDSHLPSLIYTLQNNQTPCALLAIDVISSPPEMQEIHQMLAPQVASTITHNLHSRDIVGYDEKIGFFLALLSGVTLSQAKQIAQDLQEKIKLELADLSVFCTDVGSINVRIGVTKINHYLKYSQAIHRVSQALEDANKLDSIPRKR